MNRLLIFLILLLQFATSKADTTLEGITYSLAGSYKYKVVAIDDKLGESVTIPENIKAHGKDCPVISIDMRRINNTLKTLNAPFVKEIRTTSGGTTVYLPNIQKIVLGDAVEYIDLRKCPKLRELEWTPSNIKTIVSNCFSECPELNLGKIKFGENLASIGAGAFQGCTNLKSVDFENCTNLEVIQSNTFKGCTNLKSVNFNNCINLKSIGAAAFFGCTELSPGQNGTLQIPLSCTNIGDLAFGNCSKLKNVKAYGWKLSEDNITDTGQFSDCTSLVSISLPDNLEHIPAKAFSGCENLKYIVPWEYQNQSVVIFPKTIKIIGESAFSGCKSLTNLLKDRDIKMPDDIKIVEENAFENCTGLISISFPLTEDREIIAYKNSFAKCTNLKHITLSEPPKKDDEQSENTSSRAYMANYSTTGGLVVKSGAFNGCTNLCSLPAPAGVKSWNKYDNEGWKITALNTPYYVKNVASNDIEDLVHPNIFSLYDINTVYFHSGTTSISQDALSMCDNVDRLVFYAPSAEEQADTPALHIAPMAFVSNRKLVNIECNYLIPPTIEENVFSNETYRVGCLMVPESSVELYSTANGWKNFKLITTDGQQSSIRQIEAVDNNCSTEYFNLQGMPISPDRLVPGLYIRRQGRVSDKVVIK